MVDIEKNLICQHPKCKTILKGRQRRYCSEEHKRYVQNQRALHGDKTLGVPKPQKKNATSRKGEFYDQFLEDGYALEMLKGEMSAREVADLYQISPAQVSRMYAAFIEDKELETKREDWTVPKEAIKSLEDFKRFRDRYFKTETGQKYETPDFQDKWVKSIADNIENGGNLMILSPPRHGKTELLIHFAIWQICRNPNVRIMWVGGNEDIAKNAVGSVLDHLDSNDKLIEEFCGPGQTFRPKSRSGKNWSQTAFSVATRNVTGIKSPTMVAVGKGGKILSRDCDLIIADDIEDFGSTAQPSGRAATKRWWTTTLSSRVEAHTAVVVIGSRQHSDDLYNSLLDNNAWDNIVEQAHSDDCEIPEQDFDEHIDCMLWKGKRDYKWLNTQKEASATTGGVHVFEMVYLNRANPVGTTIFNPEVITKCFDDTVDIGEVKESAYLVAGLDPAATGYQAAFLWAIYDSSPLRLQMVDIENNKGGGIKEALRIMKEWKEIHGCYHWVIEENAFQKAIRQDTELKEYCATQGIIHEGHQTQAKNKWDTRYGVTSMTSLFAEQNIILPYKSVEAKIKSDMYKKQLSFFASKGKGYKSDIVMASWFPMKVIRRLQTARFDDMMVEYSPSYSGIEMASWNDAPWS